MVAQRDVRTLRFVTLRYEALQGLREVQTGVFWLLLAVAAGVMFSPAINGPLAVAVAVPLVAAMVGSILLDQRIKAWYGRTYGRIEPDPAAKRAALLSALGLVAAVVVFIVAGLAIGLADWAIFAGCAVLALADTAVNRWRFGGLRMVDLAFGVNYGLLALLVAMGAWSQTYAVTIISATTGISFVAAGLLDHLYLTRVLGRQP